MKITKKHDNRTGIDKEIDDVFLALSVLDKGSAEYANIVCNLEKLYKAKCSDTNRNVSKDTIAIIFGNLLGIGLILEYERLNVITTKALGFVMKGRV